jgi:putative DNA primase/helicase
MTPEQRTQLLKEETAELGAAETAAEATTVAIPVNGKANGHTVTATATSLVRFNDPTKCVLCGDPRYAQTSFCEPCYNGHEKPRSSVEKATEKIGGIEPGSAAAAYMSASPIKERKTALLQEDDAVATPERCLSLSGCTKLVVNGTHYCEDHARYAVLSPKPRKRTKDAKGIPLTPQQHQQDVEENAKKVLSEAEEYVEGVRKAAKEAAKPKNGEHVMVEHEGEHKSWMIGITLDKVMSKPMKWVWEGRIPQGKGVIIHGMPGVGKSMAALDFMARVTRGKKWPDGVPNTMDKRYVVWAGTEDDLEDTVKPRLQALGADMSKITAVRRTVWQADEGMRTRRLLLKKDMHMLYKLIEENPEIGLVVFDPITGFYGSADGNSSKDIRPIMEELAELSRRTSVTVMAIMHENRRKDVSAMERILGSGAVSQVFRCAFRFSHDPKNKGGYIMACSKTNYKVKGGLRYAIEDCGVTLDSGDEVKDIGKVVWGEAHEESADDIIQQASEESASAATEMSVVDKAVAIFKQELADGLPHLCAPIHRLMDEAGLDKNARDKARWKLGVKTVGKAPGPWSWQLPKPGAQPIVVAESLIADQEEL